MEMWTALEEHQNNQILQSEVLEVSEELRLRAATHNIQLALSRVSDCAHVLFILGGEVIVFPQMNASNQQFEFIMSNSTGRSKNARKMVRSHVMSNFRRRQQLERVESLSL